MKKLALVLETIESKWSLYKYEENGVLCGYDIDTFTDGGVNKGIFLDFRDKDLNPLNGDDIIKELKSYVEDFDINDEISMYRQDPKYKQDFTLKESIKDFKSWLNEIKVLIKQLEKIN